MKRLIVLLMLMLLFISTLNVVNADETTESEDDDHTSEHEDEDKHTGEDDEAEKEKAYEREVEFGSKGDYEFEFKSKSKYGETEDQIELKFKINDGEPVIKLEYQSESSSTEVKEKFRVQLYSIVEYMDNGTMDNGYQEGIDDVVGDVNKYRLRDVEWDKLVYSEQDVSGDSLFTVTATTTDGVVKLVLRLASGLVNLDSATTLTPDALKFDVEIHNFDYESNSSSLALLSKIKTESERKHDDETEHEAEGLSTGEQEVAVGNAAFFSWAETANADGSTIDVIASDLINSDDGEDDLEENEHNSRIYFAFIATAAQDIVWDPKVGVISESTQQLLSNIGQALDSAGLPGFPIWQTLLLFALSVPIVKRRYK